MIYLHVAQCPLIKPHSPLDTLYITPGMRTRFELAEAVNLFSAGLVAATRLSSMQLKLLGKISRCRTAALGGHEEACQDCGAVRYSYNSCGDRHCPKCQAARQAFWIDDLIQNILENQAVWNLQPHQCGSELQFVTEENRIDTLTKREHPVETSLQGL